MSIVADVTSDNVVGTSQLASMTNLMMSEAEERCDIGMTVLQHFGCPLRHRDQQYKYLTTNEVENLGENLAIDEAKVQVARY